MDREELKELLEGIKSGEVDVECGLAKISFKPYTDLEFAKIDDERELRTGYPEVIFCQGKTPDQVKKIVEHMLRNGNNILATRANQDVYREVKNVCSDAVYNELGRTITIVRKKIDVTESYIAIVSAGTSDLPVVEEAYETASIFGNKVVKVVDVGVAGIHRLFDRLDIIRGAKVVIVVAGMEGALASVLGGLVDKPVIGVPTSVGYGANFGGVSALLCMLNSCSNGISVVNIDNGYGAAYMAGLINKL